MRRRFKKPEGRERAPSEVIYLDKKTLGLWRCTADAAIQNLQGVLIEGDLMVACNGHLLVCKPLPDIDDGEGNPTRQSISEPTCLLFDTAKDPQTGVAWRPKTAPLAQCPTGLIALEIDRKAGTFQVTQEDFDLGARARGTLQDLEAMPYEDYEHVIPRRNPEGVSLLRCHYLGLIADALSTGSGEMNMRLEFDTGQRMPKLLGSTSRSGSSYKELSGEESLVRGYGTPQNPFTVDLFALPDDIRYLQFVPEGAPISELSAVRIESTDTAEDGFAVLMPLRQ